MHFRGLTFARSASSLWIIRAGDRANCNDRRRPVFLVAKLYLRVIQWHRTLIMVQVRNRIRGHEQPQSSEHLTNRHPNALQYYCVDRPVLLRIPDLHAAKLPSLGISPRSAGAPCNFIDSSQCN